MGGLGDTAGNSTSVLTLAYFGHFWIPQPIKTLKFEGWVFLKFFTGSAEQACKSFKGWVLSSIFIFTCKKPWNLELAYFLPFLNAVASSNFTITKWSLLNFTFYPKNHTLNTDCLLNLNFSGIQSGFLLKNHIHKTFTTEAEITKSSWNCTTTINCTALSSICGRYCEQIIKSF